MRRLFNGFVFVTLVTLWVAMPIAVVHEQLTPDVTRPVPPKKCAFEGTPDAWMCDDNKPKTPEKKKNPWHPDNWPEW